MKLQVEKLYKSYPNGVKALNGISMEMDIGIFGLLGPNGAGKTTLMRILSTLIEPDDGRVSFNGMDLIKEKIAIRKRLGYLPQEFGLYPSMSGEMLLDYLAVLKGYHDSKSRRELVSYMLEKTGLYDVRSQKLGSYSGGMKQRFGIAQALLNNPQLIIVDEPTTGLDPTEKIRFYDLLSDIGETAIVILSTHHVDDVTELCSQMAIIQAGEIILEGRPANLLEQINGKVWKRSVDKSELIELKNTYRVLSSRLIGGKPLIHIFSESRPDNSFDPVAVDLEDLYFMQIARKHV